MPPYICIPLYIYTPHTFVCSCTFAPPTPTYICIPHKSPLLPYTSLCFRGYLHVILGCGPPYVGQPPKGEWMPPHVSKMPCMLPCISAYSMGYLHVLWARHFLLGAGGVSMSVRLLVSVSTSTGCPLCSSCAFLQFIMSKASTTMATTTTPPVTVVSSGMSSISSVTVPPYLMVLPTMLGQHNVVLLPPDIKMFWRCSWPCICATAATSIYIASLGLCQLCRGFSTGRFLFQS